MSRNEVNLSSTMALAYSNGIRYAKSVENLVILAIESPRYNIIFTCNGYLQIMFQNIYSLLRKILLWSYMKNIRI